MHTCARQSFAHLTAIPKGIPLALLQKVLLLPKPSPIMPFFLLRPTLPRAPKPPTSPPAPPSRHSTHTRATHASASSCTHSRALYCALSPSHASACCHHGCFRYSRLTETQRLQAAAQAKDDGNAAYGKTQPLRAASTRSTITPAWPRLFMGSQKPASCSRVTCWLICGCSASRSISGRCCLSASRQMS